MAQPEQPQEQPPAPQAPAQPAPMQSVAPRTNVLADIVADDHMKGLVSKSNNKGVYRPYISKLAPKPSQSPFGDFPSDFIKKVAKAEDFSIDFFEKSQAASASSKIREKAK